MAKVDFFKRFVTDLGESDVTLASDGTSAAEFTGFIDTGSYILNASLSGSIYGGFPNNKAIVFAGDPAVGKTYFALSIASAFLKQDDRARVVYFDTESAVTNDMLVSRGIDPSRVIKAEPDSIERFRTVALKILDSYIKLTADEQFPLLVVLDSLSALPSGKEVGDMTEGKDTKDMTKAGLLKGAFRVLRLKLAKAKVPMIITSHTYAVIGAYIPTKEMAGGSGAKYAADTIVYLSKKKERDADKHVVGNIVVARMAKSRLTKEETVVDTRILFDGGLDRYYGLLEHAEAAKLVKKVGNKYEFPDGTKAFENAILGNPQKFFTDDVLKKLDEYLKGAFCYTNDDLVPVDTEDTEDEA